MDQQPKFLEEKSYVYFRHNTKSTKSKKATQRMRKKITNHIYDKGLI